MEKTLSSFIKSSLLSSLVAGLILCGAPVLTPVAHAADAINTWWPSNGAHVSGTQPFKAMVPGLDVTQYEMFWQVDGGTWNWMDTNYADYPHKEAGVDVSGWHWSSTGAYTVNFIARKNGSVIAQNAVQIYVDGGAAPQPVTTTVVQTTVRQAQAAPAPSTLAVAAPSNSSDPLSGSTFYVDPNSAAARQAAAWQSSDPSGARMMQTLASASTATWFGEWSGDITQAVSSLVAKAQSSNSVPVMVAYAIPERDCGGFSGGGTNNPSAYSSWIQGFARGIGSAKAVVILEPDALAQIGCLSGQDQNTRLSLLASAVSTLKQNPNTKVYVDAGHSNWIDVPTMASRLNKANVAAADGFSLDVSNFAATGDETAYGTALSNALSGKHFVIDTSRNGNGSNGEWCNPSGRAIGIKPTASTGNALIDAYLWLKVPGESDGYCNGGPSAGSWWADYAKALVANAH